MTTSSALGKVQVQAGRRTAGAGCAGSSQIAGDFCSKANNHQTTNQRRRALTLKRRCQVAYELQTLLEVSPEIEQCCEGGAIRQQCLPRKMWKKPHRWRESCRPRRAGPSFLTHQLSMMSPRRFSLHAPRAEHQPLEGEEFRPRETSICVRRQTRARLKTIVSCGNHASFAASRTFSVVVICADSWIAR